ncbi:MBOAT family protein, partial [Candidatus Marinimicrobia bacterium]|nr:MBOAT family protein [Candidatus Neomarinimicrobiota bacterium]
MSYTIDIYRNKLRPTKSILDFSNFVAFFPQLVAGPIERAKNLLPQMEKYSGLSNQYLKKAVILL